MINEDLATLLQLQLLQEGVIEGALVPKMCRHYCLIVFGPVCQS